MESPEDSAFETADHWSMSSYVRDLISALQSPAHPNPDGSIPRQIIQYWDNRNAIPGDVQACMDTWDHLKQQGVKRFIFDDNSALEFIRQHLGGRFVQAFALCPHPAMRADYFRLCFILRSGGFYVDADDVYQGTALDRLFGGSNLKLQPLCYEISSDSMVDPIATADPRAANDRIYYVNNNPLIAPANHPLVTRALLRATCSLLTAPAGDRDIQSRTGPGNLTACMVEYAIDERKHGRVPAVEILRDWELVAISKWPLDYRSTERNWRHWTRGDAELSRPTDRAST